MLLPVYDHLPRCLQISASTWPGPLVSVLWSPCDLRLHQAACTKRVRHSEMSLSLRRTASYHVQYLCSPQLDLVPSIVAAGVVKLAGAANCESKPLGQRNVGCNDAELRESSLTPRPLLCSSNGNHCCGAQPSATCGGGCGNAA